MSIDPHTAATAIGLVNSAFSSVKTAFDLAKKTTDLDLKHEVSKAFDNVLELKATVYELAEENRTLREKLNEKASVKRNPEFGYYFADGDSDPLCPKCYEVSGKLIHLPPSRPWNRGVRRDCVECKLVTWEKPMVSQAIRGVVHRGPSGWMAG